jgi:hypothetical protein
MLVLVWLPGRGPLGRATTIGRLRVRRLMLLRGRLMMSCRLGPLALGRRGRWLVRIGGRRGRLHGRPGDKTRSRGCLMMLKVRGMLMVDGRCVCAMGLLLLLLRCILPMRMLR